jgi:hypothetical protein
MCDTAILIFDGTTHRYAIIKRSITETRTGRLLAAMCTAKQYQSREVRLANPTPAIGKQTPGLWNICREIGMHRCYYLILDVLHSTNGIFHVQGTGSYSLYDHRL